MSERRRNPQHSTVFVRKLDAGPLAELGRASLKVHRDIKDFAPKHSDQFPLRLPNLVMKPTQHPALRTGMIVLYESGVYPEALKRPLVIALEEKSSRIAEDLGFNNFYRAQLCIENLNARPPCTMCQHQTFRSQYTGEAPVSIELLLRPRFATLRSRAVRTTICHTTLEWRLSVLKRESGGTPGLPRSGKQERTP